MKAFHNTKPDGMGGSSHEVDGKWIPHCFGCHVVFCKMVIMFNWIYRGL